MQKALPLLIFFLPFNTSGQDVSLAQFADKRMMITGSLDFGYTFHAGFDFGFHFGAGVYRFDVKGMPLFAGVSSVYRAFSYGGHRFRVIAFNAMLQAQNRLNASLGLARTWYNWGYESRNTNASRGWGRYYDVNYRVFNSLYSPVVGYRAGKINNRCMSFVTEKARSLYTGYRLDVFFLPAPAKNERRMPI